MKKVLLTSAAVVAAAAALNAAPVHAYGNWTGWDNSHEPVPAKHTGVVAPANQYKPAQPATNPRGYNDNGYGAPTYTKGTVAVTVVDLSTGKPVAGATVDFNAGGKTSSVTTDDKGVATLAGLEPGTAVAYRLNVPAGYEEDSYNGHVTAVAGNVPATFSIRPATVQNNRPTTHPAKPGQSYGDAVKSAWVKDDKGQWSYLVDEQGTKATGWKQIDGKWYFFNAEGVMQKWWVKVGNTWYYLNGSGEMQTGWLLDGGKWYFLEASGAMKASQWFQVKDKWYHVDGSGALSVNTTVDGYTVNGNGEWV